MEPEETAPETVSYTASMVVPERDQEYRLDICYKGTKEVYDSKLVPPGTTSVMVEVAGSGIMYFDLYVDGEFWQECDLGFTQNE